MSGSVKPIPDGYHTATPGWLSGLFFRPRFCGVRNVIFPNRRIRKYLSQINVLR
jgi:hypothetical protein